MADVATLIVRVGAQTRDLEAAFARSTRKVEAFAQATSSIGSRMLGVTAIAAGLGGAVVQATATFDALGKGLESQAGSAAEAAKQFQRLREIAKAPGIDLEQAVKGSIQLQAVGASAQLAERTLKNVGRAVAASAGGPDQFAGVNRQLQQIAGKGKVLAQDLNIIKENAPAMAKALQAAFGSTTAEGIEKLNLSTEEFFTRLNEGIEKSIPQVEGGLGNALTNLRSSVSQAFASLGSGQANELTKAIDSLAKRIENAALAFSRLSPQTQRYTLYAIGLTAAIGPLLIAVSALANAYRTLAAISIASATIAATRAFIAKAAAVRTTAAAMALATTAARGLTAAMFGPVGIIIGVGLAAAAWIHYSNKTKEAARETEQSAQRMVDALAGVSDQVAKTMLNNKNLSTAALMRGMQGLRGEIGKTKDQLRALGVDMARLETTPLATVRGPNVTAALALLGTLNQQEETLKQTGQILNNRLAELKVLADDVNSRIAASAGSGNDFAGGAPDDKSEERFKAEKKLVALLQDAVNLHHLGLAPVRQAIAYQEELSRRAAVAPFRDQVELLTLAEQLAGAVANRLQAAADAAKPMLDRASVALSNLGLEDSTGNVRSAQLATAQIRLGADAQRAANDYAARYPLLVREGAKVTGEMADEAERIRRAFERLANLSKLSNALAGVLGRLGSVGERLAEVISQAGDLADAFAKLKESQSSTGSSNIFASIGNFTSALGVAAAAIGVLGSLFGGGDDEAKKREEANTEAMERLASQLNALEGTARQAKDAQIAAGRLAANAGLLRTIGMGGREVQMDFVNRLIGDLGITFADLNRMAKDLGLEIIRENGTIATDALDELAKALGFNVQILTRLGSDMESFRQIQEAANRIYNVEASPEKALNDAIELIRKFAGDSVASTFAGMDQNTAEGRAAIQASIQALFEKMRSTAGISIDELGRFKDAQAFLSALLGADSALDQFRENAEKAAAAMLNVPQGFKTALRVFQSTIPSQTNPTRPPFQPPTGPATTEASPVQTSQMSVGTMQFVFNGDSGTDGRKLYANWYDEVQRKATAHPPMRAWASGLAAPSRN